ncbi:MAG: hypothetical protein JSW70_05880 [Syntrophobacterales bacterium]|nr:MAG: hypothetical protein JSW70_05880 [Syntrophobacterales bacterium]
MVPTRDQNTYKVLFLGIVDNSAQGRRNCLVGISKRFRISSEKADCLISKTPILFKRGLSLAKAEALVNELESLGGRAQFIPEEETPLLELELEAGKPPLLQLESLTSSSEGERIEVIGRVKNISPHPLSGVKVVAQFFNFRNQFISYEESSIAFSFLHPDQFSPFKVRGKGNTWIRRISIAFKGEDGEMINVRFEEASPQKVVPSGGNNRPRADNETILKQRVSSSKAISLFLNEVFSKISKDEFTQVDVEEVMRGFFPEKWALLEKKYEGVAGGSGRQYLAGILSWYAQEQGSSIQYTGTFAEGPPGWGVPKMAIYKKGASNFPPPQRVSLTEFDGQSPLRNFACPKISQKSSSSIVKALIKGYNEEKIPHDVRNFNHLGFNAKSLVSEEETLVRFLSLVLFDRWPFQPWEMVWEEDGGSINALLKNQGLFHAGEIRRASLDEIESTLRKCVLKGGLWLYTNGGKTRFARTLKELSLHVGEIASSMKSASKESDIMLLHQNIMNIHGFNAPISARCIAYAMRELGAGRTSPEMFEPIARCLRQEWRTSDWGERLEFPLLGGRLHLFDEIIELLSDDPLAFDYLYLLGADYCQDGNCEHCSLS